MTDRFAYYQTLQNTHDLFLSLKDLYKRKKLSDKNKPEIMLFLEYSETLKVFGYLEFAVVLVSDEKLQLGPDPITQVYDGILKDKKLHPLLPRFIFPNWIHFKQNRPDAIDLLLMYLPPQKIRINQMVRKNLLIHYGSHFKELNSNYQNRIFEYCLINDCENRLLLKVYANHYPLIREELRNRFMEKILLDRTVKNNYFNAFLTDLILFADSLRIQVLDRISK